jgi:hypothetical protein
LKYIFEAIHNKDFSVVKTFTTASSDVVFIFPFLNKSDFKWAEDHAAKVSADCKLYLQPEWDQSEKMLPLIIDYVKQNPQWEISLQLHKFMEIP